MSGVGVPVTADADYFAGDAALGGGRGTAQRGLNYGLNSNDELFMSLGAQLGQGFSPDPRGRSEMQKGAPEDGFEALRYQKSARSPRYQQMMSGDSATSPASPISPMAHSTFRDRYPENASRTTVVRRYADDLYKIRPVCFYLLITTSRANA